MVIAVVVSGMLVQAQDERKDQISKFEQFSSKTGVIVKFVEYEMPNIPLNFGVAETEVREVITGGEVQYFYRISKDGKYDTKIASIAYEDLLEIKKAYYQLNAESADDGGSQNYLENKFITDDGFQVGYYVSKGKITWFMKLEKFGTGTTIFIKDGVTIISNIEASISKIDQLRSL